MQTRPPGCWRPASPVFRELFPRLHDLLHAAHATEVVVAGRTYLLFSWPGPAGAPAWLCVPPLAAPPEELHREHRVAMESFGGIVERADEPESWLLNHNEALTASEASRDASFLADYAWAFEGRSIPIDMTAYYSIAREANGNTTLCHRRTGEVLLFAPDHSFTHVRNWNACPNFTLYELNDAPTFRDWVNLIATQWLDATQRAI